jgi:hypothetical protein
MATNEYRGGTEKAEDHNVVTWDRLAEICGQYLCKLRVSVGSPRLRDFEEREEYTVATASVDTRRDTLGCHRGLPLRRTEDASTRELDWRDLLSPGRHCPRRRASTVAREVDHADYE